MRMHTGVQLVHTQAQPRLLPGPLDTPTSGRKRGCKEASSQQWSHPGPAAEQGELT